MDGYECAGFYFYSNFDSGNLHKVENLPKEPNRSPHTSFSGQIDDVDAEFNLWTKPDCAGTEFENVNRTWFYFGIKCPNPTSLVKFNMMNLNKQAKLYSQGMGPVYKIIPGKANWDRICDKPTYTTDNNVFILSFKFRVPENILNSTIYLAFTYPYTFSELQAKLDVADRKYISIDPVLSMDDIYYVRECLCNSLEGRRVDLITISSYHNITTERENRLRNLFPDNEASRPLKFMDKKVIFLSARVHPGETPSSFVLNGFLNLLLSRDDPIAIILRKTYVFKLIPCLNPDGVANGHYRTDTRGVNLNRVYLNPSFKDHPSIYAARALIRYHHYGFEKEDDEMEENVQKEQLWTDVSQMTIEDKHNKNTLKCKKCSEKLVALDCVENAHANVVNSSLCIQCGEPIDVNDNSIPLPQLPVSKKDSGLFLYIDMHGHASKKGIFMFGNHFDNIENSVECMLLPKIMSINNPNFHFSACNFTEKNMYLKDKRDGMSKEGSGRVAVYKITGLVKSYTLECNYNTGRLVNMLPPAIKELPKAQSMLVPPKYSPLIFEEVGKAIGYSILDLSSQNPYTRIPNSEYHTLNGLREFLSLNCGVEVGESKKSTTNLRFCHSSTSLHAQGKAIRSVILKTRSLSKFSPKKINMKNRSSKMPKKEKIRSTAINQPSCSYSDTSFPTGSAPVITMMQVLAEREGKPKAIKTKVTGISRACQTNLPKPKEKITPVVKSESLTKSSPKPTKPQSEKTDRIKLKEICFVKDSEGKRVIAKYDNGKYEDDSLIVAWNANCSKPQVFSHTSRLPAFLSSRGQTSDGAPKRRAFRVHNFQKSSLPFGKTKRNKRVFKRVASPPENIMKKKLLKKKSRKDN